MASDLTSTTGGLPRGQAVRVLSKTAIRETKTHTFELSVFNKFRTRSCTHPAIRRDAGGFLALGAVQPAWQN